MKCRKCEIELPAEAIDREALRVSCPSCGAIFRLRRTDGRGDRSRTEPKIVLRSRPSERMRRISAPPQGIQCDLQGEGLKLHVRLGESPADLGFSAPQARMQARLVLFLLALFIMGGTLLLGLRLTGDPRPALILAIVASIGVSGFVALSFDSLGFASFVVDSEGLRVKSHPLGSTLVLKSSQLDQLYCQRAAGSTPGASPDDSLWSLRVLLRSGQDLSLALLPRLDQALFLEEEIEEFLDIVDRPMRGEVAKPQAITGGWRAEFQR